MAADLFITTNMVRSIVNSVNQKLGERHAIQVDALLDMKVSYQFADAIKVALMAFFDHVEKSVSPPRTDKNRLIDYLKSDPSTDEISKLLDPGVEIFDPGAATKGFESVVAAYPDCPITAETIHQGWDQFIKAFSFALRTTPALREFLRASLEAGGFRSLSTLADALIDIEGELELAKSQESLLSESIIGYTRELSGYKAWAATHHTP